MLSQRSITLRRLVLALIAVGAVTSAILITDSAGAISASPVAREAKLDLPGTICGPGTAGQPALLKSLVAAATKTETAPFQPQAMQAASGDVPIYRNLGALAFNVGTRVPRAQAYVNQGVRLAFAFNHAEAQRAFQAAQRLDPDCAMCFWGEALVLGPNINAPMVPEANRAGARRAGHGDGAEGQGRRARSRPDRRAGQALFRRSQGRPGRARRRLCRRDEGRRRPLSGRRHRADPVRRSGDGHPAVGLLGSRGSATEGPRRRDRGRARDRAEAQPVAPRRDPPVHPRGRGVDESREGAAACQAPRRADAGRGPCGAHAGAHLLPGRPLS